MWSKADSGTGMNWEAALAWVRARNAEKYLGHNDWCLPHAKELRSIVDYTRSPDTTGSPAIDPLFTCTQITFEVIDVRFLEIVQHIHDPHTFWHFQPQADGIAKLRAQYAQLSKIHPRFAGFSNIWVSGQRKNAHTRTSSEGGAGLI